MDRRLVGGLVLAVAVIAALAGNARTKQVAGDVVRGPLPDPPAVGDCVLEPLPESVLNAFNGSEEVADHLTVRMAPCTGARYGEVVAVVAAGLDYSVPTGGDIWSDPNSPANTCSAAAGTYLGAEAGDYLHRWSPATAMTLGAVGPDPVLAHAGQRWLACLVVGLGEPDGAVRTTHRYSRTLRDALSSLRLPPELAQCAPALPAMGASVEMIPCGRPHSAELFGTAWSDRPDDAERVRLTGECTDFVRKLAGTADPTAGGRLRVRVTSVELPPDSSDTSPDAVGPMYYYCGVEAVAGHVLTGPLLGLGIGPLPVR